MSPPNRADARTALAGLLAAGVPAAAAVYDHQAKDFDGQTPVICVTSAASERARLTLGDTRGRATFAFDVHTFVLYEDAEAGWTPADAETALDQLEQEVFAVVLANPRSAHWRGLAYREASEARDTVVIGGAVYLHEIIPIAASVF